LQGLNLDIRIRIEILETAWTQALGHASGTLSDS
jgi:hypothetical protein